MKELIDNPKYSTLTKFTKDLDDDSILKNHLISTKVKMVRFVRVHENKKSFYYLRIDYLNIPDSKEKEFHKDDIRQISTNIWRKIK